MIRASRYGRMFYNGNLNIQIPKEDLAEFNKDQVLFLDDLLSDLDCEFIGETYCLNNFETGHTIFNSYMNCCYIFAWSDLDRLAAGKTVKLYDNDNTQTAIACDPIVEYMSIEQLKKSIERTRKQMESAAEKMEFIEAAQYRDEMFKLMEILKEKESLS